MTNVWCIRIENDDDGVLELLNEGFHGAHGSVADAMEMIEDGKATSVHITIEDFDPKASE